MFIQQLLNGLSVGSIYALMAVGYSLVYSLLNFTNFAHSLAVTFGAFAAYFIMSLCVENIYVGIMLAIVMGGVLSMIIEQVSYRPLLKKNVKRIYLLIAGLGTMTVGENLMIIFFTSRFRSYPINFSTDMVKIFGASVGQVDLIIFILSVLALIIVEILIRKTRFGLAIRGASYDLNTAAIMGVNTQKLILFVFLLAGTLAGLAGAFLGAKYTAYPALGSTMTNKAFVSAVLGGLGSIPGAVLGALILGVGETMISGYISSSLRDLFAFALLIIVLIVKPNGLMGKLSDDKA